MSSADGSFSLEVPAGPYAITITPPTPFNVAHDRIDTREKNAAALEIVLRVEPSQYLPDTPPVASRIEVSPADENHEVTVAGSSGALPPEAYVILITLDTGNYAWAKASVDGSFEATLFAPAGASILAKVDPVGTILRGFLYEVHFGGEGVLSPLTGTILRVPDAAQPDQRTPFFISGAEEGSPPWTFQGTIDAQSVKPGGRIRVEGVFEIVSPLLEEAGEMEIHPNVLLEQLAGPDGRGSQARNLLASTLLTPTGLPIERHARQFHDPFSDFQRVPLEKINPDRVLGSVEIDVRVPANLPAGYYVPVVSFFFEGMPNGPRSTDVTLTDKLGLRHRGQEGYLPIVKVGDPAAPGLYWTLLADTLSNGSRGAGALEDRGRFALAPRVMTQSEVFVIPRSDPVSGSTLTYRLEPFAPTLTRGDRGISPPPPVIPFRFPSGFLKARILKPDGNQEARAEKPLAGMAIRTSPGEFATLPVSAIN